MTRIATQANSPTGLWHFLSQDNEIYRFFRLNIAASYTREEGVVHILLGILLFSALTLLTLNQIFFHFTVWPIPMKMFTTVPAILLLWLVIGHTHQVKWPRFGLVAITSAKMGLYMTVCTLCCMAILTTPFQFVDYSLVKIDHWFFGFDVTVFMAWAYQYPDLIKVLTFCYNSWFFQILLTPLVLALFKKSTLVNRYYMGVFICLLFMTFIYYFFPTVAPAGVMQSPYFADHQYALVTRFYEIHQYLPITEFAGRGVVALPSAHVMLSLLVLTAWRKVKFVFYPLVIIDCFLIMATMALGYHYLTDILASFAIVAIALTLIHFIYNQFLATKNSL